MKLLMFLVSFSHQDILDYVIFIVNMIFFVQFSTSTYYSSTLALAAQ